MSVGVTYNIGNRPVLSSAFLMARRSVLGRDQKPCAHDFLFCPLTVNSASGIMTPETAPLISTSILQDVIDHGLASMTDTLPGILHLDADVLMSDAIRLLPPHKFILRIATAELTDQLVARMAQLQHCGFRFSLACSDESAPLSSKEMWQLADSLAVDISGWDDEAILRIAEICDAGGKPLVVFGVGTIEQFTLCASLGIDHCQGNFFAAPRIIEGKTLSPSQLAITDLLVLLASDADNVLIEHSVKANVSLGLNLLRLANTPALSAHRVDSLRQALMVLGRDQLQRWLQIMLYANNDAEGSCLGALGGLAATRARLMELIAQKSRPGNRGIGDVAFTVGIMSLMDTLFGMSMEAILRQIPVVDDVREALLHRNGYYGKLLSLAEDCEWHDNAAVRLLPAMHVLKVSCEDLYLLQLSAFQWSDEVMRSMP